MSGVQDTVGPLRPEPKATGKEDARSQAGAVGILAVVVLYKVQAADSSTLQTLTASADYLHTLRTTKGDGSWVRLRTLIADNTPGESRIEDLPCPGEFRSFPHNPGLAPVYNLALAEAEPEFEWLLTLDQDTHLPREFLALMAEHVVRYKDDCRIAAIVPRVFDTARRVSPFRFIAGFPRLVGPSVSGVLGPHASAINSASLLRIGALKKVGGYDDRFPLNNSDTALFDRLDHAGYRIALAGEVSIGHELAMVNREDRMTLERYRQLLKDERDFWDLHMGAMARTERVLRLMGRLAKSYLKREDIRFRRVTASELKLRLFTSRSARMRAAGSGSQA